MLVRHSQQATKRRSSSWSSAAETEAPVLAESSTRLKQAAPEAYELEEAIQASLSAALDDLDSLEFFAPQPLPRRSPGVVAKVPRGMPPLPHGRIIPPLPVSRLSLVPPLIESEKPRPIAAKSAEPEPKLVPQAVKIPVTLVAARPRRWPGVMLVLFALALLAGFSWMRLR